MSDYEEKSSGKPLEPAFPEARQRQILRLAVQDPAFFSEIHDLISEDKVSVFGYAPYASAFSFIETLYRTNGSVLPTPETVRYSVLSNIMTGQPGAREIHRALTDPIDPRDAQIVRQQISSWAKERIYESLWTDRALKAMEERKWDYFEKIIERGRSFATGAVKGFTPDEAAEEFRTQAEPPTFLPPCRTLRDLGLRYPAGHVRIRMGQSGKGKSLYEVRDGVECLRNGYAVAHADYENDLHDILFDYAVAILEDETPEALDRATAAKVVGDFCETHCGRRDALLILDVEDTEGGARHIIGEIEKAEKKRHVAYSFVIVDGFGDMTDPKLEEQLKSEWRAQKKMVVQLVKWAKTKGKVLLGTVQPSREGEKATREATEDAHKKTKRSQGAGADHVAGSISFYKKAKEFQILLPGVGSKLLKCRLDGTLTGRTIRYEYVRPKVSGVNRRGFVRETEGQPLRIRDDLLWKTAKAALVRALRSKGSLAAEGQVPALEIVRDGQRVAVQDSELREWTGAIGKRIAANGGFTTFDQFIDDLRSDGLYEVKDTCVFVRKERAWHFFNVRSEVACG